MGLVTQALIKFKAVFILPIIVHFLSKEDIGTFRIITTSAGFLIPLVTLNIFDGSGIFLSADFNKDSVSVKYNSLLSSLIYILPFTLFLSAAFLFLFGTTHLYWVLILLFIASSVVFKAFLTPYQAYQKSKKIVLINFINEYANAALTLLLIYFFIKNYYALFIPVIIMQLLISVYLFFDIKKEITLKFYIDKNFIKKVVKVSLPLLPVYIGEWLLTSISIYFLENFRGLEEVGTYSVAFSIASLILILRATLQYFWFSTATNLLQNQEINHFKKLYTNVIKIYLTLIVSGIIFYGFYSEAMIKILANNHYLSAQLPIVVLAIAFSFFVFSGIFNGVLYGMGETKVIFYGYLVSGVITIITSYVLVKNYGVLGAAFSSMFGYAILAVYLFLMTNRKIHFPMKKMINKLSVISIVYLIIVFSSIFLITNPMYKNIIGGCVFLAYLATIVISRSFHIPQFIEIFKKER